MAEDEVEVGVLGGGAPVAGDERCACDGDCGHHGGLCPERFTPNAEVAAIAEGKGNAAAAGHATGAGSAGGEQPEPEDLIAGEAVSMPRRRKRPRLDKAAAEAS